jgi:hypothetical protein
VVVVVVVEAIMAFQNITKTGKKFYSSRSSKHASSCPSSKGATKGGGGVGLMGSSPHQNRNLKNTDSVDIMLPKFYMISPSAEISH